MRRHMRALRRQLTRSKLKSIHSLNSQRYHLLFNEYFCLLLLHLMYGFLQTFANNIMDWLLNPHSFHLRFEVETFRLLKCLNISERIEAKIDLDLFIDEIFMFSRFCLFE